MGIAYNGERRNPPDAPFFFLELGSGEPPGALIFAAGLCSEREDGADLEAWRYAISLARDFFRVKGAAIRVSDYRRMLQGICLHIHRHLVNEGNGAGVDLLLATADTSRLYGARGGGGALFVFRQGEAKEVLAPGAGAGALLGIPGGEDVETGEAPLKPGDVVVLCCTSASAVMGARDITLILRRASEPAKAALFFSAIAERKGAESPHAALVWEVPNLRGAAMLIGEEPEAPQTTVEEAPSVGGDEAPGDAGEVSHADQAKRRWLSKWKRRKE